MLSQIGIAFLECILNFKHFENKWASYLKYFWKDCLSKISLLKCIKGLVSENHPAMNMLTSPKNCYYWPNNLHVLKS